MESINKSFIDLSLDFFTSDKFWYWHGLILTIDWFLIAFVAILIQKKFHTSFAKFIHGLMFMMCIISTHHISYGAVYKTYLKWYKFPKWSFMNKSHKVAGIILII